MKTSIALLALVLLLLIIVPVYAQESTAVPTAEVTSVVIAQPAAETHPVAGVGDSSDTQTDFSGATTLMLLLGLGAVGTVAGVTIMRQNYKPPQE